MVCVCVSDVFVIVSCINDLHLNTYHVYLMTIVTPNITFSSFV